MTWITHVLRADEWLSTAPLHLLLYEALDGQRQCSRICRPCWAWMVRSFPSVMVRPF